MTRIALLVLIVLAILAFFVAPEAPQAYWPMFQKDRLHTGMTFQDGAEGDSVAWQFPIVPPTGWDEDVIWASPIINPAGNRVYMATRFGRLYCLALADGDSLWARDLPDGISGTPALANGLLYVLAEGDRSLYCLDAADGDSIWAKELGDDWYYGTGAAVWMESSATVVGDSVVYVGSRDGTLYCLYTANGITKWQSGELGDYISSSPAYNDQRVYVGTTGGGTGESGVYCLNAADGDTLWYYTAAAGNPGGTMSSPLIANERIYIGMNNDWDEGQGCGGSLVCFHEDRQQEPTLPYELIPAWSYGINCDVRGTPVAIGGNVYATSGKGLYAFDAYDGELVLGYDHYNGKALGVGQETWSSFAVSARNTLAEAETLLFVGDGGFDSGHGLYCLDLNLDVLWHDELIYCPVWGSPAIAGGKVVIGSNDGVVYCFVDDQQNGRIASPNGSVAYSDYGGERTSSDVRANAIGSASDCRVRIEPNPFGERAAIRFTLPVGMNCAADLSVVDVAGRLIRRLAVPTAAAASNAVEWDGRTDEGSRVAPGVYLYRLRSGRFTRTGRVVVRS